VRDQPQLKYTIKITRQEYFLIQEQLLRDDIESVLQFLKNHSGRIKPFLPPESIRADGPPIELIIVY